MSGNISATGGGPISGAYVNLMGQANWVASSNASGNFTLTNSTTAIQPAAFHNMPRLGISGDKLTFSFAARVDRGSVEFFLQNGRRQASIPLTNIEPGTQRISLPQLAAGVYFMRVKLDQEAFTYKLTASGIGRTADLGDLVETQSANGNTALAKRSAVLDTLRIMKAGYKIKKIAIDPTNSSGLPVAVSLDSVTGCGTVPAMAAASTLPAIAALPNPFTHMSGTTVSSQDDWRCRQLELKAMISYYEYGPYPAKPDSVQGTFSDTTLTVRVVLAGKSMSYNASVHLPSGPGPFPAFIMLTSTPLTPAILNARGIAYILFNTADIAVDAKPATVTNPLVRSGGIYTLYGTTSGISDLMAWGWAAGRILDVLPAAIPQIDPTKVAIMGFSRWGKGALVTGAYDERFAMVVPSSSGSGGVGTYRNAYGVTPAVQTLTEIIGEAPQWFGDQFTTGNFGSTKESRLPYDAHETVSLIAPRPVIITEGGSDSWNNPPGPALSAIAAKTVYQYLGLSGLHRLQEHRHGGP